MISAVNLFFFFFPWDVAHGLSFKKECVKPAAAIATDSHFSGPIRTDSSTANKFSLFHCGYDNLQQLMYIIYSFFQQCVHDIWLFWGFFFRWHDVKYEYEQ